MVDDNLNSESEEARIPADLVEKIAGMILHEYDVETMARVMSVSVEDMAKIVELPEVCESVSAKAREKLESVENTNNSWDAVEEAATQIVKDNLKYNRDHEYALKAATLANKATRRNSLSNQTVQANGGSSKVVIILNTPFIERFQNMDIVPRNFRTEKVESKSQNFLAPSKLEDMLRAKAGVGADGISNGMDLEFVDGVL